MILLPTKGAKSLPLTEHLNFPPITVNNLFKFSAQWSDLALFVGNGTKVKIPSEIKPSLATARQISENTENMFNLPNRQEKTWSWFFRLQCNEPFCPPEGCSRGPPLMEMMHHKFFAVFRPYLKNFLPGVGYPFSSHCSGVKTYRMRIL